MVFITIRSNSSNYNDDDDGDDDNDANDAASVSAQPVSRAAKTWPVTNSEARGSRFLKPYGLEGTSQEASEQTSD